MQKFKGAVHAINSTKGLDRIEDLISEDGAAEDGDDNRGGRLDDFLDGVESRRSSAPSHGDGYGSEKSEKADTSDARLSLFLEEPLRTPTGKSGRKSLSVIKEKSEKSVVGKENSDGRDIGELPSMGSTLSTGKKPTDKGGRKTSYEKDPLIVRIVNATNLKQSHTDQFGALATYCICEIPGRDFASAATEIISEEGGNPYWDHRVELFDYQLGDPLKFTVWEYDPEDEDEVLGEITMKNEQFFPGGFIGTLRLDLKQQQQRAEALLSVKIFLSRAQEQDDLEEMAQQENVNQLSKEEEEELRQLERGEPEDYSNYSRKGWTRLVGLSKALIALSSESRGRESEAVRALEIEFWSKRLQQQLDICGSRVTDALEFAKELKEFIMTAKYRIILIDDCVLMSDTFRIISGQLLRRFVDDGGTVLVLAWAGCPGLAEVLNFMFDTSWAYAGEGKTTFFRTNVDTDVVTGGVTGRIYLKSAVLQVEREECLWALCEDPDADFDLAAVAMHVMVRPGKTDGQKGHVVYVSDLKPSSSFADATVEVIQDMLTVALRESEENSANAAGTDPLPLDSLADQLGDQLEAARKMTGINKLKAMGKMVSNVRCSWGKLDRPQKVDQEDAKTKEPLGQFILSSDQLACLDRFTQYAPFLSEHVIFSCSPEQLGCCSIDDDKGSLAEILMRKKKVKGANELEAFLAEPEPTPIKGRSFRIDARHLQIKLQMRPAESLRIEWWKNRLNFDWAGYPPDEVESAEAPGLFRSAGDIPVCGRFPMKDIKRHCQFMEQYTDFAKVSLDAEALHIYPKMGGVKTGKRLKGSKLSVGVTRMVSAAPAAPESASRTIEIDDLKDLLEFCEGSDFVDLSIENKATKSPILGRSPISPNGDFSEGLVRFSLVPYHGLT